MMGRYLYLHINDQPFIRIGEAYTRLQSFTNVHVQKYGVSEITNSWLLSLVATFFWGGGGINYLLIIASQTKVKDHFVTKNTSY